MIRPNKTSNQGIAAPDMQLNFVRQPLLQRPVADIISPKGDKLASLEGDGRIKLLPGAGVRREEPARAFPVEQQQAPPVEKKRY